MQQWEAQKNWMLEQHPLQRIRYIADESLRIHTELSGGYVFSEDDSIPSELLVRVSLLKALYSFRCMSSFIHELRGNIYYRWFVGAEEYGMACTEEVLTKAMDRFLMDDRARWLLLSIVDSARASGILANPHFNVDIPMLRDWAMHTGASVGAAVKKAPAIKGATAEAKLTGRQIDVLRGLVSGKTNKKIACDLGITEGTVKIHLAAIFKALSVKNRTEAAITARHLADLEDADVVY